MLKVNPLSSQSTGLHMTYEDNKEWINHSVAEWVRSGVCVVARDPDTGKIGGTLLATILTREQANTYHQALFSPKTKVSAPADTRPFCGIVKVIKNTVKEYLSNVTTMLRRKIYLLHSFV